MFIHGIESLVYGVDDLAACTRYFEDFGLPLVHRTEHESRFQLEEGSKVVLRPLADARIAGSAIEGCGVHETVLGVTTGARLEELASSLERGRKVSYDPDGTAHFLTDCGLPLALRVYDKRPITSAPDGVNGPGHVVRLNTHRKWRRRAIPRTLQHVVFAVQDVEKTFSFFKRHLHFRISDYQPGYGIYARADGTMNHHNVFLLNAKLALPGLDGSTRFHHANFGVEDIDEIMIGANYMQRRGWPKSHLGLGRHRIDSALFYYLPCPAGGEVEYGADADYVNDAWVPRYWTSPLFGYLHYAHEMPPFFHEEPAWSVRYLEEGDFTS